MCFALFLQGISYELGISDHKVVFLVLLYHFELFLIDLNIAISHKFRIILFYLRSVTYSNWVSNLTFFLDNLFFDYGFYSIPLVLSIKLLVIYVVLVLVQDTTEILSGLYSTSLILMAKLLTFVSSCYRWVFLKGWQSFTRLIVLSWMHLL